MKHTSLSLTLTLTLLINRQYIRVHSLWSQCFVEVKECDLWETEYCGSIIECSSQTPAAWEISLNEDVMQS